MNFLIANPLSANFTKWSNTLKQFVGKLPTNCLSVFGNFVGLALKGLKTCQILHFKNENLYLKITIFNKFYIHRFQSSNIRISCLKSKIMTIRIYVHLYAWISNHKLIIDVIPRN